MRKKICIFDTASIKIPFLPHFHTLQIIKYGSLQFFSPIPHENTHFYVPENERKIQIEFWTVWLVFRVGSQVYSLVYTVNKNDDTEKVSRNATMSL